jgi:hypothetical protein
MVHRGRVFLAAAALCLAGCASVAGTLPDAAPPAAGYDLPHDAAAVAALRWALHRRGFSPDVADGAVVAWPPPDHPDAALVGQPPPAPDGLPWPDGDWLVETAAGERWVDRDLAVAPADDTARLAERAVEAASPNRDRWSGRPRD